MPDDDIEIGEDIEVEVVLDEDANVIGTVTDDLVVASAPEGSLVDETIDVRDADGNLTPRPCVRPIVLRPSGRRGARDRRKHRALPVPRQRAHPRRR